MVSKKILGAAIAAALASQGAFAAMNLNGSVTPVKIAKQSILSTYEVGSTGFYTATDNGTAATDFDVVSKLGAGLTVDQRIWVRVNLTNARFATAVAKTQLTVTSNEGATVGLNPDTITAGGAIGDDYVIFSAKPATGDAFFIDDTATFDIDSLQINGSNVGVEVLTYDQAAYAIAGLDTNKLFRTGKVDTITFPTNGVSAATSAQNTVTASVNELFKKFVTAAPVSNANKTAQLSQVYTSVGTYSNLDGNTIALADMTNPATSTVKYKGDFTTGTWYVSDDAVGTTKTALTLNTAKTEATATLADITGKPYLLVVENGTAQIPASNYTADITFTAPADAVFGAASPVTGQAAGAIDRDGTTVLVPFVNLNPDFNQKIIIVNRSTNDAALTLTNLVPDVAATASSITAGTINLAAGKQTVLKSTDLVSITGSNKGAVTLNIAAPSSKIDVLFQTTNPQGAQNTVLLQNDGGKFGSSPF